MRTPTPQLIVVAPETTVGRRLATLLHAAFGQSMGYPRAETLEHALALLARAHTYGQRVHLALVALEPGNAQHLQLAAQLADSRPSLPLVVLTTAAADPEWRERLEALKPAATLESPWRVSELVCTVGRLLPEQAANPLWRLTA